MVILFLSLVSAAILVLSIALLKLYRHTPSKELKRQARAGDHLAKEFYRVVAYGRSLDILLWFFIGLSAALFFDLIAGALAWPLALFIMVGVVWFAFAWLPNSHVSRFTVRLALWLSPPLHWLLERLQPVLLKIGQFVEKVQPVHIHTGLYTKEDIIDLIRRQKVQIDNRITKEELFIVEHALQFGDLMVSEVMTPRRVMKTVATTDMVGPVLFKELHDSGHSRFPVYKDNPDDIVGTLYLRDALGAKAGGFVKDLYRREVFYVNQGQSLARVLDAFIKTKHHQFLVVNKFEEIVGLVTIEDVIESILGKQIIDEFDSYEDLRAVAAQQAEKDEAKRDKAVEDGHASPEEETVVESKEAKQKDKDKDENPKRDAAKHIGKPVTMQGWLHKKRLLGGLTFINLRDRSGVTQVVVEDKAEVEKLRGLQIGTVLEITGNVVKEERAPGGAELHDPKLTVLVPVTDEPPIEIDKAISHKPEHLDTLFEHRVIGLRNLHEQKVFKIRANILRQFRDYLNEHDFVEIQSPKVLGSAPEGGTEVFKFDYFGQEATLAQSPQLYKQIMVGVFERVFEIGPAFRAEPSATTRHMSESMMLDIEMGFVENYDEVLDFVGTTVAEVLRRVYKSSADDLKSLNAPDLVLPEDNRIPRLSVAEIHGLYSKANQTDTTGEKDLSPDEERWASEHARKKLGSDLVYITEFPLETHKFYQRIAEDGKSVMAADLLFRGVEIATVPMRENDYSVLLQQMKDAGIDPDDPGFKYYLQAFKYGLPQHGGCGFGIDRFTQKVIGLGNVKEATLFPRDINRLTP